MYIGKNSKTNLCWFGISVWYTEVSGPRYTYAQEGVCFLLITMWTAGYTHTMAKKVVRTTQLWVTILIHRSGNCCGITSCGMIRYFLASWALKSPNEEVNV